MADDAAPADDGEPKRKRLVRRNTMARAQRIACTACGSPIDVKNAAMAEMATCAACGAVLDLESDEHEVLRKIVLDDRPPSPLQLGQKGKLKGVEWEVIGRIRLRGGGSTWNEYLLFNPRGGYAWLTLYHGHWTFLRRSKKKPPIDAKTASEGQSFSLYGKTFKVIEKGRADVTWVEGEFPWQVAVDDTWGYMDAVAPPHMACAEWTAKEIEWTAGNYVEPESIQKAFRIKAGDMPRRVGVGACQPYEVPRWRKELAWGAGAAAVLCILLAVYSGMAGRKVTTLTVPAGQYLAKENEKGFVSKPFKIDHACIEQMKFHAPVNNSWVYLNVLMLDEEKNPVLSWSEEISYYHGHDWSEGSQSSSEVFFVDEPGTYRLALRGQGGRGNTGRTPRRETVTVTIYEDVVLTRYFVIGAILFGLVPILEIAKRGAHEAKRNED